MVLTPRISIIIPTYNRSRLLARALRAFHTESLAADRFEIIVSDDGSSDGTETLVRSFEADYQIKYHYQEDKGFRAAAARNAGAGLAGGDVLAFLDAGALPGPRFAASHLSAHTMLPNSHSAVIGPTYGYEVNACDIRPYAESVRTLSAEQIYRSIPRDTDPRYATFAGVGFDLRRLPLPPLLFWAGNCSVRTEDFWNAGGFDESFREWGLEDVDLAYRLWDHGTAFTLCQEGWAIELPQPRDKDANMRSVVRNIERFLQGCNPMTPAKEILAMLVSVSLDLFYDIQGHYRALIDWEIQAKGINVLQEVQSFCRASAPGMRLAILGVGSSIPESWKNVVLFDFDRQFSQTPRVPGCGVHHRIGLRTGLPDNSIDSLLITSRMRGIWGRLGDPIMIEAKRVANDVRLAWNVPKMAAVRTR
ncbi:MAG: glycosyltransferase [Streptosporangiaceae bacterium]|nr:glycosyltransferase [Streptosporangiaceae bacterium]